MNQSDDLLFVRAVALQRAGELEIALAAFQHLRKVFPESPLAIEARFRIATLLRDQHESGAAVVEMLRIIADHRADERKRQEDAPDQPLPSRSVPQLHLESELQQWIDTLLQLAPLAELERSLTLRDLEPEFAVRLREMLQLRHLAGEDFAAARRFVQPAAEAPANAAAQLVPSTELFTRTFQENGPFPKRLEGDEWSRAVANLEKLTRAASAPAKPTIRAQNLFALAEAWSALRGRLTLPASEDFGMCKDQFHQVWAQRYANARTAGFTETAAATELERQDELRHAFRYYLDSAEASPGTPLSARALWAANDAIRRIAELSPWLSQRAFETNASTVSRQLHERLLRECPTSQEAKRLSVWWSFPPKAELHWMPGKWQDYDVEFAIAAGFGDPPVDEWSVYPPFRKRLEDVGANAGTWDSSRLIEELNAIRAAFLPVFASSEGSSIINDLDDLTLFLQEPGLTPSVRAKYFAVRLGKAPPDVNDSELQHWRDYVAFLAIIRDVPPVAPASAGDGSIKPMSERMKDFLATYPNSRKREAALARLAIATVHETRTHTGVKSTAWPDAPKLNGYKAIVVRRGQPFDAARVFSAIDNYEREFPNGRYKAEMRLWRGAASIDAGDWETALNLLVATLDDPSKRDLHLDASLNLADIFMRLIEQPQYRPEIIAAIAKSLSAQQRLHQFMHSETLGARLCCLEEYLQEQFAAAGAK